MKPLPSIALVVFAALYGCSSSPTTEAPAPSDAGVTDATTTSDGPEPLPPAPAFTIEEEAESPCVATTSAQAKPVTTDGTVLADLARTGDRFVARKLAGGGFVTFAADGTNVTEGSVTASDNRVAGSASGIVAAGIDDQSSMLFARAFDSQASPLGASQPIGPVRAGRAFAVAIGARTPGSTAVVWVAPPSEIRARVLDAAGTAGPSIRLEDGPEFDDLSIVAAPSPSTSDASELLVMWSLRRIALSSYRVYAALLSGTSIVGLPRVVFGSDTRIALTGLATRPGGATLLANRDGEPLVVPLDVLGRASAPARLFKGARDPSFGGGQGVASAGDRIAILAAHRSGTHALRILGPDGKPEAGWVCLDAPSPDAFHLGSIVTTDTGFAALVATPTGSAVLALDATGMTAP